MHLSSILPQVGKGGGVQIVGMVGLVGSHRIHVYIYIYGIFTYIYHKNQLNVGKYTIHGSYGVGWGRSFWFCFGGECSILCASMCNDDK